MKKSICYNLILVLSLFTTKSLYAVESFIWSGALGSNSVQIKAKLPNFSKKSKLELSESLNFKKSSQKKPLPPLIYSPKKIVTFSLSKLKPDTRYYYRIAINSKEKKYLSGSFKTLPKAPKEFQFAFGSCSDNEKNSNVWDAISNKNPLFFIHMGDIHYENIAIANRKKYVTALEEVLGHKYQGPFYEKVPIVYTWDDHDYGNGDSYKDNPGRETIQSLYREYLPHYPLVEGDTGASPIYHAFSVGRVRFIISDLRSEKSDWKAEDNSLKSNMGQKQKEWFYNELKNAQGTYPLIVWVSSIPWGGKKDSVFCSDKWCNYTSEREEISNFILKNKIKGLCMLSGDWHGIGIGDGSDNNYASNGKGPGFPRFQAAPLDRKPHEVIKGGPYNKGISLTNGQFGLMKVIDKGKTIDVLWTGHKIDGSEVLRHSFKVPGN